MKQQVFYIHGGESYINYKDFLKRLQTKGIWDLPDEEKKQKWTDTLAADLGSDFEVFMPQMPNKQNAKYEEWKIWFERHFEHLRDDVVLVGCSLGAMFLLKYVIQNQLPFQPKALYLMAGPIGLEGFDDKDCLDFLSYPNDIPTIQEKVPKIVIMHSKDDFVVPYEHAVSLKKLLSQADLLTFEDKNHFLVPELPELLTLLRESASH